MTKFGRSKLRDGVFPFSGRTRPKGSNPRPEGRLRRRAGGQGLPEQRVNRFGRSNDFDELAPESVARFDQACETAIGAGFNKPVSEILRQSSEAGAAVVVVLMPMHSTHLNSFYSLPSWSTYQEYIRNLTESQGGTFVDASRWIGDDSMFDDHLHLGSEGAAKFSDRLGALLANSKK